MTRLSLRRVGAVVPVILAVLACACGSLSGSDPRGQVLVVDAGGNPLRNATVLPDPEFQSGMPPKYTDAELQERATNAQGIVLIYLDDYYWKDDACYHLRVHLNGYEDETVSVSKELLPQVLRIDLRPRAPTTNPAAPGRRG